VVILIIRRIFSLSKGFFKKQLRISRFGINSVLGLSNKQTRTVKSLLDSIFLPGFRGGGLPVLLIDHYGIMFSFKIKRF
jgi:hypothetical protein